jgi:carbonyl reductase 1
LFRRPKFLIVFFDLFPIGAVAPSWLALLPSNIKEPKGGYVWYEKQIVDWVNGPVPTAI